MRNRFALFLSALIVALSITKPSEATDNSSNCQDFEVIFARGTGQELNDKEYKAFKETLTQALTLQVRGLSYKFYELGTRPQNGYRYPAKGPKLGHIFSTYFSAGEAYEFGTSVNQGINELKSYISQTSTRCPNTKYVLSGYSQGAMVITKTLDQLDSNKIIYIANFGDPKNYLPEGQSIMGSTPKACRGELLSKYRIYAPNCHTYEGLLSGQNPYQTANYTNKIGIWCENKDLFCGAGVDFLNVFKGHTSYIDNNHFKSAADIIINKLFTYYPNFVHQNTSQTNHDLVIVIDRTESMRSLFLKYKEEVYKLAKRTLDNGGRVAVFTYSDINEQQYTTKILDFDCNYIDVIREVSKIIPQGGGDNNESALSALKTAMTTVSWRKGATKSITLITDAGYHNPDFDGVTMRNVIDTSLSIDPVNIYVLTTPETSAEYQDLAKQTNGKVYINEFDFSHEIYDRPEVNFAQESYFGKPNEKFTFTLTTPATITKYEWDLDFDGTFETITNTPTVITTYPSPNHGFLQARVTDAQGLTSTASAAVNVSTPQLATLSNIATSQNNSELLINYSFGPHTKAVAIIVDETLLGINTSQTTAIANSNNNTVKLIAISEDGNFGQTYNIQTTTDQTPDIAVPNTGGH